MGFFIVKTVVFLSNISYNELSDKLIHKDNHYVYIKRKSKNLHDLHWYFCSVFIIRICISSSRNSCMKINCKQFDLCPLVNLELESRGLSISDVHTNFDKDLLNELKDLYDGWENIINAGLSIATTTSWNTLGEQAFNLNDILKNNIITSVSYYQPYDWHPIYGKNRHILEEKYFGVCIHWGFFNSTNEEEIKVTKELYEQNLDGDYVFETQELIFRVDIKDGIPVRNPSITLKMRPTKPKGTIHPIKNLYHFVNLGLRPSRNKIVNKAFMQCVEVIWSLLINTPVKEGFYE